MTKNFKGKTCSRCERWRPRRQFAKHPLGKYGLAAWCRKCHREYSKEWYRRRCMMVMRDRVEWEGE